MFTKLGFPHRQSGDDNNTYLIEILRIKWVNLGKALSIIPGTQQGFSKDQLSFFLFLNKIKPVHTKQVFLFILTFQKFCLKFGFMLLKLFFGNKPQKDIFPRALKRGYHDNVEHLYHSSIIISQETLRVNYGFC